MADDLLGNRVFDPDARSKRHDWPCSSLPGHLIVDPEARDVYVAECVEAVKAARAAPGCLSFAPTADTLDPRRVCVFERWEDEQQLLMFRGSGPSDDQQAEILDADVKRYEIASVEDP